MTQENKIFQGLRPRLAQKFQEYGESHSISGNVQTTVVTQMDRYKIEVLRQRHAVVVILAKPAAFIER